MTPTERLSAAPKKKRYPQGYDGVPVRVRPGEVYGTACCDCLLTHNIRIVRRGKFLLVYKWRMPRTTAALRRHRAWKWKGAK